MVAIIPSNYLNVERYPLAAAAVAGERCVPLNNILAAEVYGAVSKAELPICEKRGVFLFREEGL